MTEKMTRTLMAASWTATLAVAALAVLVPTQAAAGTVDDPEIQDASGDEEATGVDVTKAWFEPAANRSFRVHVMRADGFPARNSCTNPADEVWVSVSFEARDAAGERPPDEPAPEYPSFVAMAYSDCPFSAGSWTFVLGKWQHDQATQHYSGWWGTVSGEIQDGVAVMTVRAAQLGFPPSVETVELYNTYLFSWRGPYSMYVGDAILTPGGAKDRGPDDGFGRNFKVSAPPEAADDEPVVAAPQEAEASAPAPSLAWLLAASTVLVLWYARSQSRRGA